MAMFFDLGLKSDSNKINKDQQVIIIGSGPAGLTSGIYTARGSLNPLVIAGRESGGQLMTTNEVENYPGFPDIVQGPFLINQMRQQAQRLGVIFLDEDVINVDFSQKPYKITTDSNQIYTSNAIIIATGAKPKEIGLDSERNLRGRGVSYCATCDAPFFSGVETIVYGGGDVAFEEALFLTKYSDQVTVVYRRGKENLRAERVLQDRAFNNPKISFLFNHEITEVLGNIKVEGVRVKDKINEKEYDIGCGGLLVAIGYEPLSTLFEGKIEMDRGYITHKKFTMTSVSGVFAAGDVVDYRYRQAITAAAEGCQAAIDLEKWLQNPHEFE